LASPRIRGTHQAAPGFGSSPFSTQYGTRHAEVFRMKLCDRHGGCVLTGKRAIRPDYPKWKLFENGTLGNIPWALLTIGGDFSSEADRLQEDPNAKKIKQTSIQSKTDIAGYNVEEIKRQTEQAVKDIFPILEFLDLIKS